MMYWILNPSKDTQSIMLCAPVRQAPRRGVSSENISDHHVPWQQLCWLLGLDIGHVWGDRHMRVAWNGGTLKPSWELALITNRGVLLFVEAHTPCIATKHISDIEHYNINMRLPFICFCLLCLILGLLACDGCLGWPVGIQFRRSWYHMPRWSSWTMPTQSWERGCTSRSGGGKWRTGTRRVCAKGMRVTFITPWNSQSCDGWWWIRLATVHCPTSWW